MKERLFKVNDKVTPKAGKKKGEIAIVRATWKGMEDWMMQIRYDETGGWGHWCYQDRYEKVG